MHDTKCLITFWAFKILENKIKCSLSLKIPERIFGYKRVRRLVTSLFAIVFGNLRWSRDLRLLGRFGRQSRCIEIAGGFHWVLTRGRWQSNCRISLQNAWRSAMAVSLEWGQVTFANIVTSLSTNCELVKRRKDQEVERKDLGQVIIRWPWCR